MARTLTREVLQRARLVPTKDRFDVLAIAAEDVQATVMERDELLTALEAVLATGDGVDCRIGDRSASAVTKALDLVRRARGIGRAA